MAEKKPNSKDIGTCRFYENKYPNLEDVVVVKVNSIEKAAVYVHLLEYNNADGMIPMTEVSRRRIRSIGKHLRVGKTEVVQVFRVDKEKGYIDLSKKRVTPDDVRKCEDNFTKSKQIHSIMMHIAKQCSSVQTLEELYQKVAWPLAKQFGNSYEAFKQAYANPKILESLDIDEELKGLLIKGLSERLKVPRFRIRADIDVTCFAYEGIDAVKAVLIAGQQMGTADCPVRVTLVAAPSYVLRVSSLDREGGIELIESTIKKMKEMIAEKKGNLIVQKPPRVVSERELERDEDDDDDDDDYDEEEEEEEEEEDEEGEEDE